MERKKERVGFAVKVYFCVVFFLSSSLLTGTSTYTRQSGAARRQRIWRECVIAAETRGENSGEEPLMNQPFTPQSRCLCLGPRVAGSRKEGEELTIC